MTDAKFNNNAVYICSDGAECPIATVSCECEPLVEQAEVVRTCSHQTERSAWTGLRGEVGNSVYGASHGQNRYGGGAANGVST